MAQYSDLPFELRRMIRYYAFEEGSYRRVFSSLATVCKEWQFEVEKHTFKTLYLELGDFDGKASARTFTTMINTERYRYLEELTLYANFPEGFGCYKAAEVAVTHLAVILNRLQGLGTSDHPRPLKLKLHPILVGDGGSLEKTYFSDVSVEQLTRLFKLTQEIPKIPAVVSLQVSADYVPFPVTSALIRHFPNLQEISLEFDLTERPAAYRWSQNRDSFLDGLYSALPQLSSVTLSCPTYWSDRHIRNGVRPIPAASHPSVHSVRELSRNLQRLHLDSFSHSSAFYVALFDIPQKQASVSAGAWYWPNLRELRILVSRDPSHRYSQNIDASSGGRCSLVLTAAGRAAAEMPLLEEMCIDIMEVPVRIYRPKLEFRTGSRLREGARSNIHTATLELSNVAENPLLRAAWEDVEKARGITIHTTSRTRVPGTTRRRMYGKGK